MFSLASSRKVATDRKKIEELLTRGVEEVFVRESLEKKLLGGKRLRVKFGIDPTGSKIHIGRAVVFRKLKAFQDLGHQIVFIIGDFTAQIGDPSDKLEKRPMLTSDDVERNLKTYREQAGKILNLKDIEFHRNSRWLSKLTFKDTVNLAEMFSVGQMLARRNFKERYEKGQEISLREFLYPLMQGYDSIAVRADVEVGGFDQLFNLKAGRVLERHYGLPEQDVLATSMLPGTDGRKMSTTWGNVITIVDEPNDMFGKVMSIDDSLIENYFLLCTDTPTAEIPSIAESLHSRSQNPRDIKARLAREIVTLYHGEKKASGAEENFNNTFKKKGVPSDTPKAIAPRGTPLVDFLLSQGLVSSKADFRRLIAGGAISSSVTGEIITDEFSKLEQDDSFKIGKRRFIKVEVN